MLLAEQDKLIFAQIDDALANDDLQIAADRMFYLSQYYDLPLPSVPTITKVKEAGFQIKRLEKRMKADDDPQDEITKVAIRLFKHVTMPISPEVKYLLADNYDGHFYDVNRYDLMAYRNKLFQILAN